MTTPLAEWRIEWFDPKQGIWRPAGTVLVPLDFTETQAIQHHESLAALGFYHNKSRRATCVGKRRT